MHSVVRKAFVLEAIANLGIIPLVTHPRLVLPFVLANPAQINPAAILFTRMFGSLVAAVLSPLLFFGLRTRETQKLAYVCLAIGEGAWIPIFINEGLKHGQVARGASLKPEVAWLMAAMLSTICLWRVYVLVLRPDMLSKPEALKRK